MKEKFDIAVIGSGAAGIAAAVCAARTGAKTLLLDKNSAAGGTGGFSGLTTLCGLYDEAGNFLNTGFPKQFAEAVSEGSPIKNGRLWVLPYRPEKFRGVSEKFFGDCQSLKMVWNSPLENIVVENEKIISLNGFDVGAVIDCSGMSDVAQKTGIATLETDETTQASSVVFQLRNVTREIRSTADAAQVLLPLARAGFPPLHFHINLEPDSITAKFSGPPETVPKLIELLRANVRGFENCSAVQKEFSISRRAGKMTVGEYVLTGADALGAKKFPDAVARCAWPMEQWGADGKTRVRFLPPGDFYEIPARSLRAVKIKNLFMAGKTISADADAIASARVMGCCLATGEAAAGLAAQSLK
ncbi:MAG TPA: FAD-dependent oxidoreductase [Candidatus Sulfotelmatobacter sp.]|nr:FAD-dependent oxidoreductase [Candidatus Sulfotelmatobacter sp.]